VPSVAPPAEHSPTPLDLAIAILDAIDIAVLLLDHALGELHRNPTARRLLEEDPDAPVILAAAEALAANRVHLGCPSDRDSFSRPDRTTRAHVRTDSGYYLLGTTSAPSKADGWAMITIVPISSRCLLPARLCDRHGFTPREAEVAMLLARGERNADVARLLGVSAHTARHHTERVLSKLGVRSRACVARVLDAAEDRK